MRENVAQPTPREDDRNERERRAALSAQRVVEARLRDRVPPRGRDADDPEQRELGRRAGGEQERRVQDERGERARAEVAEPLDASEQHDHAEAADEPGAGPHRDTEAPDLRRGARAVDEVEGHISEQHVEEEVGELEQHEPARDERPPERGERRSKRRPSGVRPHPRVRRGGGDGEREREHGERREQPAPPEAERGEENEQHRSGDRADTACDAPARHVRLAALRVEIHQRRLRERDERAGRRKQQGECHEQDDETRRPRDERERGRRADPAADDDRPSPAAVAQDPEQRFDQRRGVRRHAQQHTDLRVAQLELVAQRRPRRFARAEDELVEQLDREQRDERTTQSAQRARHVELTPPPATCVHVCTVASPRTSDMRARTRAIVHCLSEPSVIVTVCDDTDAGKRTLRQTTSEVKTMGNSIRDAMTGTPRLVTDRDIVTRVVAAGKEDGRLVGILAQAAVAREGEDSKTGRLVEEISN